LFVVRYRARNDGVEIAPRLARHLPLQLGVLLLKILQMRTDCVSLRVV